MLGWWVILQWEASHSILFQYKWLKRRLHTIVNMHICVYVNVCVFVPLHRLPCRGWPPQRWRPNVKENHREMRWHTFVAYNGQPRELMGYWLHSFVGHGHGKYTDTYPSAVITNNYFATLAIHFVLQLWTRLQLKIVHGCFCCWSLPGSVLLLLWLLFLLLLLLSWVLVASLLCCLWQLLLCCCRRYSRYNGFMFRRVVVAVLVQSNSLFLFLVPLPPAFLLILTLNDYRQGWLQLIIQFPNHTLTVHTHWHNRTNTCQLHSYTYTHTHVLARGLESQCSARSLSHTHTLLLTVFS